MISDDQLQSLEANDESRIALSQRAVLDFVIAALVAVAFFGVAAVNDAVEAFLEFSQTYEDYEVDEILVGLLACGVGAIVFALRRMRELRKEIDVRIRAEAAVKQLAMHDPLTGLPNRRLFEDRLNSAISLASRQGATLAVVMFDLDRFKPINDLHGHAAGDELLKAITARVGEVVRDQDTLARFGGDEFAVLQVGGIQPLGALRLARRLIKATEEPFELAEGQVAVGLSAGIALFPANAEDAAQLVRRADVALCRAKNSGRANFCFFEAEMDAQLQERTTLERDLKYGIANGQIEPYYQPIVDLYNREIVGFEALARWNHPDRGLVMPDEFIGVAEDSGLIGALGRAVLKQACHDALEWPAELTLSINISPTELRNPHLASDVLKLLDQEGFPPDRLEIELTENALIEDLAQATTILGQLKAAGVKIALDDFGTGYSSLANLRDLALDKIKIDRSFVSQFNEHTDSASIVTAMIALGQSLGLRITAEGIEIESQLSALQDRGCALGQGYLFSKPVSHQEIKALLASAIAAPAEAALGLPPGPPAPAQAV